LAVRGVGERRRDSLAPAVEDSTPWKARLLRINVEKPVTDMARVHVKVQVRHLLIGAWAGGMPNTQAIRWKGRVDGA